MPWFQLDDGTDTEFRVMQAGTAAFGLYARCGVWVARNLTDGFVPAEVAAAYGTREWIEKLVATGLWSRVDGGFGMPDYLDRHKNKTAEKIQAAKDAAADRQAKMRERSKSRRDSRVSHNGSNGVSHTTHSSPSLKGEEGGAPQGGAAPPSITLTTGRVVCSVHNLELPCRGCAADAAVPDDLTDLDQRPPSRDELRAQLAAARGMHQPGGRPTPVPFTIATADDLAYSDAYRQLVADGIPEPTDEQVRHRLAALMPSGGTP